MFGHKRSLLTFSMAATLIVGAAGEARVSDGAAADILAGRPSAELPGAPVGGSASGYWGSQHLSPNGIARIRSFLSTNAPEAFREAKRIFYPFGGADAPYPAAFFPEMELVVLAGLEPVGDMPDVEARARNGTLGQLVRDVGTAFFDLPTLTFFRTDHMTQQLAGLGTTPLLTAGLSLAGCHVTNVERFSIDAAGRAITTPSGNGTRIAYFRPDGRPSTLIYLSQNLHDGSLAVSPQTMRFLENQRFDTAFFKASSYMPHRAGFTTVNSFVARQMKFVLQSDNGLPFRYFDPRAWNVKLFGLYAGPLPSVFREIEFQQDLLMANAQAACSLPNIDRELAAIWNGRNVCGEARNAPRAVNVTWGGFVPFGFDYETFPLDRRGVRLPTAIAPHAINMIYATSIGR